jgi:hypothetical protein
LADVVTLADVAANPVALIDALPLSELLPQAAKTLDRQVASRSLSNVELDFTGFLGQKKA